MKLERVATLDVGMGFFIWLNRGLDFFRIRKRPRSYVRIGPFVVRLRGTKMRTFSKKGTVCVGCGCEGAFWAIETQFRGENDRTKPLVLNLYALKADGQEIMMTLDHIKPRSRGGLTKIENLQPMCLTCNSAKADYWEEEKT